jgi:hypothetical protein
MIKSLEYCYENGTNVKFYKYTIDTSGIIKNKKTGKILGTRKKGIYNACGVYDDSGKQCTILIGRALVSTFKGRPPTIEHTADHIDRDPNNDILDNLRWATKSEQSNNQARPETYKTAFVIVKDEIEKTVNQWVLCLKEQKTPLGHEYTERMIQKYASKKHFGFSYKEYHDLPEEVWKEIIGSGNIRGRWQISDMNRVKYITVKGIENVLSESRLRLNGSGYPTICINGRDLLCHILAFKSFFPEVYAMKKPEDIIKHIGDNKLDFRPHMLQLGTQSENSIEAHFNGCHGDTKTERMRCVSYVNGIFEREHDSQSSAMKYLKLVGYNKASIGSICMALSGKLKTAYNRTWKLIQY